MTEKPPIYFSTRFHVIALLCFFFILDGLALWFAVHHDYQDTFNRAQLIAQKTCQSLEERMQRTIVASELILQHIAEGVQERGIRGTTFSREEWEKFRRDAESLPDVGSLWLMDNQGDLVMDSTEYPSKQLNSSEREYFKPQRDEAIESYIGPIVKGKITHKYSFTISRRIAGKDGNFLGIVLAAIEVDDFTNFLRNIGMGGNVSVAVFRTDGALIFRQPMADEYLGKNFKHLRLFSLPLDTSPSGFYEADPSMDRVKRLVAYQKLKRLPLVAVTTVPMDAILQEWQTRVKNYSITAIAGLFVLVGLSWLVLRSVSREGTLLAELERRVEERTSELVKVNEELRREVEERKQAEEESRRLEERLQRAQKMEALGTLAGGVAHDLNNVLGVIVGYSELLLYDSKESSPERSLAMEILKGGQRAAAIVQDLLTLARRGVPNRTVLNLNNILMDSQKSAEFEGLCASHPNLRIMSDLEADLLNMVGSSVHLEKSFLNLVYNAAEAMADRGVITIKTRNQYLDKPVLGYDEVKEGDYVVLSISDTGEGIPAVELKRIFEPFYTKKVMGRSGTGLGLAVVWGTVKDHGGYINVESEEGTGTTFTLYFPVSREGITPEQVSTSAFEYTGSGESILIVDDVKEQRELAAKMLMKLNYRAITSPSGEEAVEYLKRHAVDLVVLDMIMDGGMDGLDTYSKIIEICPYQKAIIVSGFSETERVSKAQALGAGAYVKKPYVLEKLGLAVRKELDRPA